MKRIVLYALVLGLLLTVGIPASAAENTYDLPDLGLEMTIPSSYRVLTRYTPATDPVFDAIGTTFSEAFSLFKERNVYLNAISDPANEEIVVTMTESSLTNYSLFSDTLLDSLGSLMAEEYPSFGFHVSKYEIYHHAQAKFIKLYFTDAANTVHGLQYSTIYDGMAMNFTMRSYSGSISQKQEDTIKTVVDSIRYDNDPPAPESGEDTDPFTHTDPDTGVTFTVPANWKQEEFHEDREFLDIKFVSTKEAGCMITYSSTDLWEEMTASEKLGYKRSDLNDTFFTKADVAEMYDTTVDKVSTVTYNGVQYFKFDADYSYDVTGLNISFTMTQLVYVHNGWIYLFQFSGQDDHALYSQFEQLLNSVQYPDTSNVPTTGSSSNTPSGADNSDSTSALATVGILMLVAGIVVAVVIIKRKMDSEAAFRAYYAPEHTGAVSEPPRDPAPSEPPHDPAPSVWCRICGQRLPADSEFCHKCGTRIIK